MRLLLDTNACTYLLAGREEIVARVRQAEGLVISAIVVGELLFGFRNGTRHEANRRLLEELLMDARVHFLPVTMTTCERFGRVAVDLRKRGRPIPSNDIWIAAHAMESGSELISYDRHFEEVPGLAFTRLELRR